MVQVPVMSGVRPSDEDDWRNCRDDTGRRLWMLVWMK